MSEVTLEYFLPGWATRDFWETAGTTVEHHGPIWIIRDPSATQVPFFGASSKLGHKDLLWTIGGPLLNSRNHAGRTTRDLFSTAGTTLEHHGLLWATRYP